MPFIDVLQRALDAEHMLTDGDAPGSYEADRRRLGRWLAREYLPERPADVLNGTLDFSAVLDADLSLEGAPICYSRMHERTPLKVMLNLSRIGRTRPDWKDSDGL